MKKYIRAMLDDLRNAQKKDYVPPIPKPLSKAKTTDYDTPRQPVMPYDLDNQELSKDPEGRVRQLDWQAQQKVQNPGH
jgi:hypothetical protein